MSRLPGVPVYAPGPDGRARVANYLTLVACANCGVLTPATAMLRDPEDGAFHCVECPGEGWLARAHGPRAAAAVVALREGGAHPDFPDGLSREAVAARYDSGRKAKPDTNGLILELLADRGGLTVDQLDALLRDRGCGIGREAVRARLHALAARGLAVARRGRGGNAPAYWSAAGEVRA